MEEETIPASNLRWYRVLKVFAAITGIAGSVLTAISGHFMFYGFTLFFVSSAIWVGVAWRQREISLLVLQACFLIIDVVGMWRWK